MPPLNPSKDPFENNSELIELYGKDYAFLVDIFETFLFQSPDAIAHICLLAETKDFESLSDEVHRIKATFQMVGLSRGTQIAQLLELYADEKNHNLCSIYAKKLLDFYQQNEYQLTNKIDWIKENKL